MLARGLIIGASAALLSLLGAGVVVYRNTMPTQLAYQESSEIPCNRPNRWPHEHGFYPGCSGMSRAGPFLAEMRFNSEGLRDQEYPPEPAKGTLRILLLGASNVLGVGIRAEDTLDRRLEKELAKLLGRRVEVVNAAVNGYCTWQSAISAEPLLERYHPALVLAFLIPNSCSLNDAAWESRVLFRDGIPWAIDRSPLGMDTRFPSVNRWAFADPARFAVVHTLGEQFRRLFHAWRLKWHENDEPAAKMLAPTWHALSAIDILARANGASFAAFYGRLVPAKDGPYHVFDQFLHATLNVPLAVALSRLTPKLRNLNADLYRELDKGPVKTLRLETFAYNDFRIPDNSHLTSQGHAELARALARAVASSFPALSARRGAGR